MSDGRTLDDLLDQWEDWQSNNPSRSIDEFVGVHCRNVSAEVVAHFRQQVEKLAIADRKLEEMGLGDTNAQSLSTDRKCDPEHDLRPGLEPISGYRLEARLGRGGFGEVWRATAPGGIQVALKFVRVGGHHGDTEQRALDVIKNVRHPHLLSVFGTWLLDEHLVIATELADRTLADRLKEAIKQGHTGIPHDELLGYVTEAAEAIDFLNSPQQAGRPQIIHRDIKPQNLLLSGRHIKVGDFGLARTLQYDMAGHTGSGTPAFSAPECLDGEMSNRSDQYSLAVTYFYLRTGKHPFDFPDEQRGQQARGKEPNLTLLTPAEQPVLARALQKKPKDRWSSCQEFVAALSRAIKQPLSASPKGWKAKARATIAKPAFQRRVAIAVVAAIVANIVGLTIRHFWERRDPPTVAANMAAGQKSEGTPSKPTAANAAKANPDHRVTLAVTDFENHAKDPQFDGFRFGLRDMLVTDLAQLSSIRITERAQLDKVLEEHKLAKGDFIDPATANPTGKGVAARSLLTGGFLITGDDVRVDLRLVDVTTGTVQLADSVTGKKADFAQLQKSLTERIIAGLKLPVSEEERRKLGHAASGDFEAFRLYSAARLAAQAEQQQEANKLFEQALARDPQFGLAKRELASVASDALLRLADADKERLAKMGGVGQALQAHRERQQAIVIQRERTPAYYAALITLSSHAGLLGKTDDERQLLTRYWTEFASHVPVAEAIEVGKEINRLVSIEGKFFQEQLDNGEYTVPLDEDAPGKSYLKTELRDQLIWPKYAVIWPFDVDARDAFRMTTEQPKMKIVQEYFENSLPKYPHDYLRALLTGNSRKVSPEVLRLGLAVVRYYAGAKGLPADVIAGQTDLQKVVLNQLENAEFDSLPAELKSEVPAVLGLLGTVAPNAEVKRRANQLAIRLSQTTAKSSNQPNAPTASDGQRPKVNFCSLSLGGPQILFVLDLGDDFDAFILPYLQRQLTEAIGLLPPGTTFDVRLTGYVAQGAKLSPFDGPQPATNETRQAAIAFVKALAESHDALGDARPKPLAKTLESALTAWPKGDSGRGEICVVCLASKPSVPAKLAAMIGEPQHPRIMFVGSEKVTTIATLVRQSGGEAVLLEEGDLLDITPKRWDVTNVK